MSDMIRYQYESNYASLDDIGGATINAQALGEEVAKLFAALSDVYTGDAALALQDRHIQISGAMDALLADITQDKNNGNQSQEDAKVLDAKLASTI